MHDAFSNKYLQFMSCYSIFDRNDGLNNKRLVKFLQYLKYEFEALFTYLDKISTVKYWTTDFLLKPSGDRTKLSGARLLSNKAALEMEIIDKNAMNVYVSFSGYGKE